MIRPFRHHRPSTVGEAIALADALPDAAFYRGGTELPQVMKLGFARFEDLADLKGVPELRGIGVTDDGWIRIGAAVTHREIEQSPLVAGPTRPLRAWSGTLPTRGSTTSARSAATSASPSHTRTRPRSSWSSTPGRSWRVPAGVVRWPGLAPDPSLRRAPVGHVEDDQVPVTE